MRGRAARLRAAPSPGRRVAASTLSRDAGEGLCRSPSRSTLFATRIVSGPGHAAAPRRPAGARRRTRTGADSAASARASARRSPSCSIAIGALAQPGRVGEHDRIAGEVDRDLDHVARRAGDRRGDRRLAPRELVQQARLAGVRRPDDRDRDAVAQPLAAMPVGQMRARSRRPAQRCPPRPCASISGGRSSSGKSIAASRCARRRSSRSPQPRYSAPSAPSSWRNAWRRCASVSAAARSATASAWVRSSLPLRKARRVNSPGSARRSPRRAQRRHDRSEHGAAAVQVQFGDVLAGGAARPRKPQRQRVVERLAAIRDRAPGHAAPCAAAATSRRAPAAPARLRDRTGG